MQPSSSKVSFFSFVFAILYKFNDVMAQSLFVSTKFFISGLLNAGSACPSSCHCYCGNSCPIIAPRILDFIVLISSLFYFESRIFCFLSTLKCLHVFCINTLFSIQCDVSSLPPEVLPPNS